jgi:transposase
MSAQAELDAMLADLADRAQAVRDFQCQSGQDRHATRKLPKRVIAAISDWRKGVAAEHGTMCNSVVATATASRVGSADKAGSPSAEQEQHAMSASPVLALRLDPETIERLDDEAELRGHTRSSLARHLLKQQLVGINGDGEHDQPTERQSAA